ncbi:hypothetical protein GCM10009755_13050 [Brevibacterium samyangense]|uniref:AMP-dependent synthetase/ligase domain-containing protein n=2 Tax=Brevibacterium samyangense TaxID=366888 RepID=A0ABN2TCE0_9MICO
MNPVFDLLDLPIVRGRAEDEFLAGSTAVSAEPVSLSYEDTLDRAAKIAGVLKLLGIGPGTQVLLSDSVPAASGQIVRLGTFRIGATLVEAPETCRIPLPADGARITLSGEADPERDVHRAFSKPVRRLPSHLEQLVLEYIDVDGNLSSALLEPLVRDARIEPGAAVDLDPDSVLWDRGDGCRLTAAEVPRAFLR